MRKRRLKTLQDLRRWLADAANRLERGEIEAAHARCITYMASVMSGIISSGDIEARLEKLEQEIEVKHDY